MARYERINEKDEAAYSYEEDVTNSRGRLRDLVAFFICGLLNNFGYVVMLSAALDMLHAANLPAAVVLLFDIFPSFVIQFIAPWFVHHFHYHIRVIFTVVLAVAGFLIPAFFESVWIKLAGVVCAAISSGFGEITFLAYSAHYSKNTVSTWSSGTGGAGILGTWSYLGLRYAFDPKWTLIISSPIPLFMAVSYFFIMGKPQTIEISHAEVVPKVALPVRTKLRLLFQLLPYMLPLSVVYFGEYLINQGVSPVMLFPKSALSGKEYEYYQAIYQVGVFVSRSSVNFVPIKNIYVLQLPAIFQTLNALLLSLVAVYNFIPNIYIVFVIIFWEGLLGGSIYVNTFYLMSQKFTGEEKEFCLGSTSMSYGLSITLCAVAGIFYEPFLTNLRTIHGQ